MGLGVLMQPAKPPEGPSLQGLPRAAASGHRLGGGGGVKVDGTLCPCGSGKTSHRVKVDGARSSGADGEGNRGVKVDGAMCLVSGGTAT